MQARVPAGVVAENEGQENDEMTLSPSMYMPDEHSDDGQLVQALRDFGLRAPWEWQRLFLQLADRIEDSSSEEEAEELRAELQGVQDELKEAKEAKEEAEEEVMSLERQVASLEEEMSALRESVPAELK